MSGQDVLIIGGGIIGVSCAEELTRAGKRVTLIDKRPIGHGCSYGNAGWITPCFAMPLPMPGMLIKSLKWMADPQGPLYIQPRLNMALVGWLMRFMRAMNQQQMLRSIKALTGISIYSLDQYRKWDSESHGAFGYQQKGLLMVSQTQEGMRAVLEELRLVSSNGVDGRQLSPDQVHELEPAVDAQKVLGGVYFPNEAHAEPLAAVNFLADRSRKGGAQLLPGTELLELVVRNGAIDHVRTNHGIMKADQYVLATGAWSPPIAKMLGVRVPILSGKGYSMIIDKPARMPHVPMMLIEKKIAITPRADSLRLAGTLELVGVDESVSMGRVDAILRGSAGLLELPQPLEVKEIWRGLRPCTPDGVPIIGRVPKLPNLLIAAGHQMLGLQSAPGTARLAADLLLDRPPAFDPAPFRVERFA
ncbi:MAG: FAD-dependent oxidoreductase [Phycisphaerales bacterium]|jgi:D-amino-acid dehydrogenase|nr:FAD-dependent oxidoreductase [Phycisphaerales bacterium]